MVKFKFIDLFLMVISKSIKGQEIKKAIIFSFKSLMYFVDVKK